MDCIGTIAVIFTLFVNFVTANEVVNNVGTISIIQPAFVNRRVTMKMTPYIMTNTIVKWKYSKDKNSGYISETSDSFQRNLNGSYYLTILNVSKSFNESYFVVEDTVTQKYISPFIQLKLEELRGPCGEVVLKNQIARLGTDVAISFYPSDVAIETGTSLRRSWLYYFENISLSSVSFSERKVSDYLFELTILNVSLSHAGRYGLKCNCWEACCVTNSEHLTVVEPPSKPELGPTTDDFSATNCIYVDADTHPYCKVMSGTPPLNIELSASFNIGDMQRYNTLTTQDVAQNSEDVSAYPFLEVERRPFRSTRETESGYVDMRDIFETCQRANCDKSFEDMNSSASTDPDEFDPRCTRKMVAESADMGYLHTVTEKR
ncbi:hypothetical protein MAR_021593 [Mya arenaria]|uniref:Uncharacterized protein n=1 Tax=Mya arenaria TaxID=6604 RepID=A0ABY7EAN1_MYAAR|nr:hypothetical protein MAR_021593 [Mya arenaria]